MRVCDDGEANGHADKDVDDSDVARDDGDHERHLDGVDDGHGVCAYIYIYIHTYTSYMYVCICMNVCVCKCTGW